MKKVSISKPGGYEQLHIVEVSDPTPADDSVLVEVAYAGVNYADCLVRWGVYESAKQLVGWPITPGFEVSGRVKKVGPKVKSFREGDQVVAFSFFNGYASHVAVPEGQVMLLPNGFSLENGAGFLAVFATAYYALFQIFKLRQGASILVHSAAGGVGSALIQLAKTLNARIAGVVGSSHKIEYVRSLGVETVIDKSQDKNFWPNLKREFPDGFDAVYDANGFTTFRQSYKILRPTGKLVVYGSHNLLPKSGGHLNYFKAAIGLLRTPRINPLDLITDNKSIIGFNVSFLFSERETIHENMTGLRDFNEKGLIKPLKTTVFNFEDVAKAHQLIESGQSVGKIVLKL